MTDYELSDAVVLWTGWGTSLRPARDDDQLLAFYGADRGAILLDQILRVESDFYRSNAHLAAPDLAMMGAQAASEFRGRHPGISDEAVVALTWCYTYDYK